MVSQVGQKNGNVADKTKERADFGGGSRYWPVQYMLHFGGVWFDSTGRDVVPQEIKFFEVKATLHRVAVEASFVQRSHHEGNVLCVFSDVTRPNHNIIEINVANFAK